MGASFNLIAVEDAKRRRAKEEGFSQNFHLVYRAPGIPLVQYFMSAPLNRACEAHHTSRSLVRRGSRCQLAGRAPAANIVANRRQRDVPDHVASMTYA